MSRLHAARYQASLDLHSFSSRLALYLVAFTAAAVIGFPLLWMIVCSFKTPSELYNAPPLFWPAQPTLQNYADLFIQTGFPRYFANSLIVAGLTTVLSVLLGSIGGYVLARFQFVGLALFAGFSLVCYMLPETLVVVPLYMLVSALGLQDTLVSLIGANSAFTLPFALWFMRGYFRTVPAAYEESAMLEGCSRFQVFRLISLPIALPGLVSVGVFAFNNAWNEYLFALVLTSSERTKTLPLGLSTWIGQDSIYSWGMLLSGAVLLTLFSLALYAATQSYLAPGLTEGGTKG